MRINSKLNELVYDFRRAIERAKNNNEQGEFFRKFPTGQCGNASDMLAQYLIDNGISQITYVNGTYYGNFGDDMQTHTWLVVNGAIIDITGDQFKYHKAPLTYDVPVYIGPLIGYYELFEITPNGMYEHSGLDERWTNYRELKGWYKTILRYI